MADVGSIPTAADDLQTRSLLVALELLRRQVADVPGAIASNAARTIAGSADTGREATDSGRGGFSGAADVGGGGKPRDLTEFARQVAAAVMTRTIRDRDRHDEEKNRGAISPHDTFRGPVLPPSFVASHRDITEGGGGGGKTGGRDAEKTRGMLLSMADMLVARFTAVLGPLGVFAQVLGSSNAGFQLLGTAVKVLASVLAPILFPVVVAVAGAIIDLSDEIEERLQPVLKDWMKFVFSVMIPVLQAMVKAIMFVVDAAMEFVDFVRNLNPEDLLNDIGDAAESAFDFVTDPFGPGRAKKEPAAAATDRDERFSGPGTGGSTAGGGGGDPTSAKRRGIDDVLTSFRLAFAPKAQFSSLTGVGQQAQLAALNADPLEARILRATMRTADAAEGALAELRRDARGPVYGTGGPTGDF